jgi:hypothetical protein
VLLLLLFLLLLLLLLSSLLYRPGRLHAELLLYRPLGRGLEQARAAHLSVFTH